MVAFGTSKETPAEQLLRMIEGPQGGEPSGGPRGDSPRERLAGAVRKQWRGLTHWLIPADRSTDPFLWNLRLANRLLWVTLAGLSVYVAINLVSRGPAPRLELAGVSTQDAAAKPFSASEESTESMKPLTQYLEVFAQRNPFTGMTAMQFQEEVVQAKTRSRLEELTDGIIVVGIDRGPEPVALIEDKSQNRTAFVKVGDHINGMVIQAIDSQGVRVSYEGEELVLP